MGKYKTFLLILLFLIVSSCALYCNKNGSRFEDRSGTVGHILPRQSFVKLHKTIKIKICNPEDPEDCRERKMGSSASGFVVRNDNDGSYIITAAHVCDDKELESLISLQSNVKLLNKKFLVLDIEGKRFEINTLNYDSSIDVCMVYAYGLYRQPVNIANTGPSPGDIVYNLAAPIGIFAPNMIPILHGHYNGEMENMAIYSVPAVGGSSGSGVFNHRGELVGLIHSVYVRFSFLSLSPTYNDLVSFIHSNLDKQTIVEKRVIKMLDFLIN
tara:strand:+ start:154 stop:963 length:810 start_codon:yes stop_codon:yes gene_type:complete